MTTSNHHTSHQHTQSPSLAVVRGDWRSSGKAQAQCHKHKRTDAGRRCANRAQGLLTRVNDMKGYAAPAMKPQTTAAQGSMKPHMLVTITRPDRTPLQHTRRSYVPAAHQTAKKSSSMTGVSPAQPSAAALRTST